MCGISEEEARAVLMKDKGSALHLPRALAPVIDLAYFARDQIRTVGGFGGIAVVGFDLPAVDTAARWLGVEMTRERAEDLAVLHDEALSILRAAS